MDQEATREVQLVGRVRRGCTGTVVHEDDEMQVVRVDDTGAVWGDEHVRLTGSGRAVRALEGDRVLVAYMTWKKGTGAKGAKWIGRKLEDA